jgi:hypothetical protein
MIMSEDDLCASDNTAVRLVERGGDIPDTHFIEAERVPLRQRAK